MEALKRQGKRTDLLSDNNHNIKARDIIGEENDLSGFQISNYLRLTYLITPLLKKVDEAFMPLKAGVVLSHIHKERQVLLDNLITENKYRINHENALKLRAILCSDIFSEKDLIQVFEQKASKKSNSVKLSRKDLKRFFPENFKTDDIIKRIFELLEKYSS